MDHLLAFSQSSTASLIAAPNAPFLPPYFITTLALNFRSRPFGRMTVVLPTQPLTFLYYTRFKYLYNQHILGNTGVNGGGENG